MLGEISWENCEKDSNGIQLLNVAVKPYPIIAPGSLTIEVTVRISEDVVRPLKVRRFDRILFLSSSLEF